MVAGVPDGREWSRAGLRPGDILRAVNGSAVSGRDDLVEKLLAAHRNGRERSEVSLVRDGRELRIEVRSRAPDARIEFGQWTPVVPK